MGTRDVTTVLLLAFLGCTAAEDAVDVEVPSRPVISRAASTDVLLADFEGNDYGEWAVEGEAFGRAPTKRPRMLGHNGNGVASSLLASNVHVGKLTSPEFAIGRDYVKFLALARADPQKTGVRLLVDGETVRSAEGARKGALEWRSWDVSSLEGRRATIEIFDESKRGWGGIAVDHVMQSDSGLEPIEVQVAIEKRYLLFPSARVVRKNGRPLKIVLDGKVMRGGTVPYKPVDPDFWTFCDVSELVGKTVAVNREAAECMRQSDEVPGAREMYREKLRPQFHFTTRRGWLNDPNGLVFHDGEWHLYYQHDPYSVHSANAHWGHAVSADLLRWKELPIVLYPDTHKCVRSPWSGSGVVDEDNDAGFQEGSEKTIVIFFTDIGAGESMAYSTDRGRTFAAYEKNPVVPWDGRGGNWKTGHWGRDPKVFRYGDHWVMSLYDYARRRENGRPYKDTVYYTSTDLKRWTFASRYNSKFSECPEMLELPVDGDAGNTRWVLYGGSARYRVGRFDGKTYTPDDDGIHRLHYGRFGIEIGGVKVEYNVADRRIEHEIETPRENAVPLEPKDGAITLRLLVDRASIEIYGNNGTVVDTEAFRKTRPTDSIRAYALGGDARLADLRVHELAPVW